ncbi:unnamed protein product [Adineta ricciae]|uniref:Uncharacterized protein n=1 Tax=Adineta ricciae TaxID=249248 RepID=A0A815E0S8_ADIRI|nr:unnamed protein product [Adineta ricciae]
MAGVNSEQNIENDDLLCPITMELFRDPLGDYLRQLAEGRRHSVVSYNVQQSTVTLPPLRIDSRNVRRIYPQGTNETAAGQSENSKCSESCICICCSCGLIILRVVLAVIIVGILSSSSNRTPYGCSYPIPLLSDIIINTTITFADAFTTVSPTYMQLSDSSISSKVTVLSTYMDTYIEKHSTQLSQR